MTIKKRKLAKELHKGFIEVRDGDHVYFYPIGFDGKKITYIRTKFSHSSDKDVWKWLEGKMTRDLYFDDKQDFGKYRQCSKKHEEYLNQLIRKGKYFFKNVRQ